MKMCGDKKIRLKRVNPCITCKLCKGYLIDATTIRECLHTFCKSCIVKHLEDHNTCPNCNIVIHQSHPLNFISHDRTMQDIVYKLVPNLQKYEQKREEKFYKKKGLPKPKQTEPEQQNGELRTPKVDSNPDCHRLDEQVMICLECSASHMKRLPRKYLHVSSYATVTHIKKFIAMKLYKNVQKHKDVDILCNEEILGKHHTLKFVCVTRWRAKDTPLLLHYRRRVDVL